MDKHKIAQHLRHCADLIEAGDELQYGRVSWRLTLALDWLRGWGYGALPGLDYRDGYGLVLADDADADQAKYDVPAHWTTPVVARERFIRRLQNPKRLVPRHQERQ
ncbi:hypothetical protein [Salinisphaera orenii]|uniref:hypothetical protein n=1 Tax=Salinisphaera orenii TaxID=856731 RepID=UPI000DBEA787